MPFKVTVAPDMVAPFLAVMSEMSNFNVLRVGSNFLLSPVIAVVVGFVSSYDSPLNDGAEVDALTVYVPPVFVLTILPYVTFTVYVPLLAFGIEAYNRLTTVLLLYPVMLVPETVSAPIWLPSAPVTVTVTVLPNGLYNPIVNALPIVKFGVEFAYG